MLSLAGNPSPPAFHRATTVWLLKQRCWTASWQCPRSPSEIQYCGQSSLICSPGAKLPELRDVPHPHWTQSTKNDQRTHYRVENWDFLIYKKCRVFGGSCWPAACGQYASSDSLNPLMCPKRAQKPTSQLLLLLSPLEDFRLGQTNWLDSNGLKCSGGRVRSHGLSCS